MYFWIKIEINGESESRYAHIPFYYWRIIQSRVPLDDTWWMAIPNFKRTFIANFSVIAILCSCPWVIGCNKDKMSSIATLQNCRRTDEKPSSITLRALLHSSVFSTARGDKTYLYWPYLIRWPYLIILFNHPSHMQNYKLNIYLTQTQNTIAIKRPALKKLFFSISFSFALK